MRRLLPPLLSALLHLALLLAWIGPELPDLAPEPQAVTVELVAPPATAPSPKAPEAPAAPARQEAPRQIPNLDAAPPDSRPTASVTARPTRPQPPTRNERDFVLAQVVRHWTPPPELKGAPEGEVTVRVTVGADGHFAGEYDSRRPWNPAEVFDGYPRLPPKSLERRTVDAFYKAIRDAQPLRLTDALKAKAPFPVRLEFRFRDVR
ncbi:hypothetical protein [Magnetospirillum sp. UT-4]|uniref:hypothetical protein n=1 Tax=Magnetospirillum sp. UT-4 TaxID=2681467 RepID=UPI0013814D4A|nr:hypothetical protein [Magnetospirillum sp. UT-4]CAA7620390.1 conserved exported hypothetical protein [Magnetospirillum sp. UT-4]